LREAWKLSQAALSALVPTAPMDWVTPVIGETKATLRAERRTQWMFFALGLAASIPIGVLINILVP
jgi:hypothetical protein